LIVYIAGRAELAASNVNPLTRFLPTRLKSNDSTILSDFTAAHHSSITWYLSRRLTEASQNQKEMQEERVKRQLERTRTLGSNAAQEAMNIISKGPAQRQQRNDGGSDSWLGGASSALVSGIAATIGATSGRSAAQPSTLSLTPTSSLGDLDGDDDDIELSQSQILQFESENANILRSVQDTLESVQQAEARLMDISNLQMELISHLTRQTELTDQLYEDAIATTATVEKGNVQLREARRRAKDSRIFILVFLIGASFSLLFLHFY
jgi:syntaxin 18